MKPDGTNNADGTAAPATAAAATSAAYPPTAPPPLHPYAVGPGPGPSPVMVAPSGSPSTDPCMSLLIVLWVVLLPPVAVALAGGDLASILINVLFTMLGFLPGEREKKMEEMRARRGRGRGFWLGGMRGPWLASAGPPLRLLCPYVCSGSCGRGAWVRRRRACGRARPRIRGACTVGAIPRSLPRHSHRDPRSLSFPANPPHAPQRRRPRHVHHR